MVPATTGRRKQNRLMNLARRLVKLETISGKRSRRFLSRWTWCVDSILNNPRLGYALLQGMRRVRSDGSQTRSPE